MASTAHAQEIRTENGDRFRVAGEVPPVRHSCSMKASPWRVASDPYPDPGKNDPRLVVVDVEPGFELPAPVPLQWLRDEPALEGWDLFRLGRLSVLPVTAAQWKAVETLARKLSR